MVSSSRRIATELVVDASGCDPLLISRIEPLADLCTRIIEALGLHVIGAPQWHAFPPTPAGPGGVTGLALLSESHLSVHTWPEHRFAALNLCCCRALDDTLVWRDVVSEALRAEHVQLRVLERSAPAGRGAR